MVPGLTPIKAETTAFLYIPANAKRHLRSPNLRTINFTLKNIPEICHTLGQTHLWDQILVLSIIHIDLHLLTTTEYYNIIKQYPCRNVHVENTVWTQFLDKIKNGLLSARINYSGFYDIIKYSRLSEIPEPEWTVIMTDIMTKAEQVLSENKH
jgi:hypothetical protein